MNTPFWFCLLLGTVPLLAQQGDKPGESQAPPPRKTQIARGIRRPSANTVCLSILPSALVSSRRVTRPVRRSSPFSFDIRHEIAHFQDIEATGFIELNFDGCLDHRFARDDFNFEAGLEAERL